MDSMLDDSIFDLDESDGFSPAVKAKGKTAPKKAAAKPAAKATTKTTAKAAPKAGVRKPTTKKTIQTTLKPVKKKASKPDRENETDDESDGIIDDSIMSNTPPSAKKPKATAPSKQNESVLMEIDNEAAAPPKKTKGGTGATDKYQMLTQIEHILKRPDTYIGSVEQTEKSMWVFNSTTESMEMREVHYVPGLYKIFDEILVNAADNKQRDKNMDTIKVTVDREKGEISVYNNGRGIPIEIHEERGIYIPEMIFGHLLTSSNYDDDQEKVTGGRNGYGAKLCNIFSTEFSLETAHSTSGKKYKQTWKDNMSNIGKAKITANKSDDYTKVTFSPDFTKFGMSGMDDDFEALVKRRVYDMAGTCRGVKVSLNGERIKIRTFEKYMEMYAKAINKERHGAEETETSSTTVITETPDVRWEIGFAVSDGSFQQVSFVNSIATTSGGTHVNYISDQIVTKLMETVKKKNKNGPVLKNNQIRNHIFLFVNCLIVNPAFTSQTKEQLTTKASQFGSKCTVSDAFLKKIAKTEAVTNILHFAQQKADQLAKKSDGGRRTRMDNPKLTDANKAGTKDGWKCTLILTEGDSAKGLAMAGRAIVGPDEFGVFPLRGKLLNVRDASVDQITKNSEIQNIKKFLGLQHKKEYEDTKSLRYGHLMIMTDQDHDGSHIKGLLINFLQVAFPSLLRIPEFLIEFITPIVKVYKGDPKNPTKWKSFFTMPEYEAWKEENPVGWEHKYYKGLGTSTTEDAQVYFRDLDRHLKEFHTMKEGEEQLIDLAFSKKKADERKEWLRQFRPGTYLDHAIDKISYTDFINKELILFSMADNMRSIPSVIDGLKPGQRKVLHACFKKNLRKDMKVVELAGHVMGTTAYQHGEGSLQMTVVGMAQTFVGSNNINYLEPSGNFGSRLQGGSDSASARYIYTRLSPFAKKCFSPLDAPLLTHHLDDAKKIEPEVFYPVIPAILINGADGIGTGWSTSIPNYNPEDVVDNLRRMMKDEEVMPMKPWFRGYAGRVEEAGPDRWKFTGIVRETDKKNVVEISELPIRLWTQDFKDKLEETIKAEKTPSFIKDYTDYNTHLKVNFLVQLEEKYAESSFRDGLEEKFKLSKTLATSNMVAFDREGRLKKYATVEEILKDFYYIRLEMYQKRKAYQLTELHKDLDKMTNQARFIKMIIDGKLVVSKKKKAILVKELRDKNFTPYPKVVEATKDGENEPTADNDDDATEEVKGGVNDYDYLLGMAIWSLTQERVEKLMQQIGEKEMEINVLTALSPKDLWNRDLDDFIAEWRFQIKDDAMRADKLKRQGRRASTKLKLAGKGPLDKKRKALGDDPDDSDFAGAKPKKVGKKVEPSKGVFNYLKKPAATAKVSQTIPTKPPAQVFTLDGASDSLHSDNEVKPVVRPPGRQRAAAKKAINYDLLTDSDDSGNDLLGDVSKMVKGIGGGDADVGASGRPLFSASASRPGSSAGLHKPSQKSKRTAGLSDDETDFSKLVPASSPRKSLLATAARPALISDDEDESLPLQPQPAAMKSQPVKVAKAVPVKKAPAKKVAPVTGKEKAVGLDYTSTRDTVNDLSNNSDGEDKSLPLLPPPAAKTSQLGKSTKAVAVRKAPTKKVAPVASKKVVNDNSDNDDDEDDDILDSSPPRAAVARPSRRAAAVKKKPAYLDSDESEEEDDDDDFSD